MKKQLFENELVLKVGNEILIKKKISKSLVKEFEIQSKNHGKKMATSNLLLVLTQKTIRAKRVRVSYLGLR
jgi:hypothetical protein